MRSRPESSIVLLIIVIAIILALGVFLLISIFWTRSETVELTPVPETAQTYTVNVEGQTITLTVDPNQQPTIIEPTAVPPEAQPEAAQSQEGEQATAQPEAAQPEAAQAEQPAQLPADGYGGQPGTRLMFFDYTVVAGDNLYRLQDKFTTSIALMAKHGISAVDIVVGNRLNLPIGNDAACGEGWRTYVVLKGDTSFGISQQSGISLEEFGAKNGLDPNYSIYETDIVCVK